MEVIAVRLTEQLTKELDKLVKEGMYPNRSEALREAARLLLRMQRGMLTGRAKPLDRDKLMEEFAKSRGFKL
jgi:Arc/MetJ-type ribon-helix-helix transcriptional regulator